MTEQQALAVLVLFAIITIALWIRCALIGRAKQRRAEEFVAKMVAEFPRWYPPSGVDEVDDDDDYGWDYGWDGDE